MSYYHDLTIEQVQDIINDESSVIIDIRDEKSYQDARIPRAIRFNEVTIRQMRRTEQRHNPVLIYCYHGHSSRDVATMLCHFGFTNVYNLDGGYTAWHARNISIN